MLFLGYLMWISVHLILIAPKWNLDNTDSMFWIVGLNWNNSSCKLSQSMRGLKFEV